MRGSSLHADENAILKSTAGFAFPGISPGMVGGIRNVAHKYWMLNQIALLASRGKIDPRDLLHKKSAKLLDQLTAALNGIQLNQVLAFTIDIPELRKHLNQDYVTEIVRLVGIEDRTHIQSRGTSFMKVFREYSR